MKRRAKFPNQFLPENTVVFTCIASVGKIGVTTTESLTNQQINSIVVNDKHDWRFVYYLLRHEARRIQGMCKWRGLYRLINKRDFEKVEVKIPKDLSMERRIASVLSTYDNLIENNRRRIQLLEQAARLLYKEWFVHLRFPGHEHTKITNGVPQGWHRGTVGDFCQRKKISYSIIDQGLPLVDLSRIRSHTISVFGTGEYNDLETARIIFKEDDILFNSIRPYLHKVVLAPFKGITNTSVFVVRPVDTYFKGYATVFLSSNFAIAYADQHTTGTKMPVVKWASIDAMPVLVPPKEILTIFEKAVRPIFQQIKCSYFFNRNLTYARDLLLPRLMDRKVMV